MGFLGAARQFSIREATCFFDRGFQLGFLFLLLEGSYEFEH